MNEPKRPQLSQLANTPQGGDLGTPKTIQSELLSNQMAQERVLGDKSFSQPSNSPTQRQKPKSNLLLRTLVGGGLLLLAGVAIYFGLLAYLKNVDKNGTSNLSNQFGTTSFDLSNLNPNGLAGQAGLVVINANTTINGGITANSYSGSGADLSNVNASLLNSQPASFYQDAGNLTSGTLNDARLSSNVALLNASQAFTGDNTFSSNSFFVGSTTLNGTVIINNSLTTTGDITVGGTLGINGLVYSWPGVQGNGVLANDGVGNLAWQPVGACAACITDGGNAFGSSISIGTNDSNTLVFRTNGSTQVTIDTAGQFGIGTSPGYKLDVNGDVNVAAGNAFRIGGTAICTSGGCAASSGSTDYVQNSASLQTGVNFNFEIASINSVGGVIRAKSGQVADLQQWQDSSGNVLAFVDTAGNVLRKAGGSGTNNIPIGVGSLGALTTGSSNIGIGPNALQLDQGGSTNIAIGNLALGANISSSSNVAVGVQALRSVTTSGNVGIGYQAGYSTAGSTANTSVGYKAGTSSTTGSYNVSFGYEAGKSNTDGSQTVAIGANALGVSLSSSTDNVGIGFDAGARDSGGGDIFTSLRSVYIGSGTTAVDGETGAIVIGYGAQSAGSNTVVIGNGTTTQTYLKGNLNVGTTLTLTAFGTSDTSTYLCRNSSNQISACSSSGSGVAFVQGGNSFGATASLGTNDSNLLAFRTNNAEKMRLTTGGVLEINSTGAPGTVEKLRVNTPTTVDNLANVIFGTSATTSKGLVVQGMASQSANLQEWQSSTGEVYAKVSSTGELTITGVTSERSGIITINAEASGVAELRATQAGSYSVGTIRGRDDGSGSGGVGGFNFYVNRLGSSILVYEQGLNASSIANLMLSGNSAWSGLVVRGAASQSANLQEWQASDSQVLAKIGTTGNLTIGTNTSGSANVNGSILLQGYYSGGPGAATALTISAGGSNPSVIGSGGGNQLVLGSATGVHFCTTAGCTTGLATLNSVGALRLGDISAPSAMLDAKAASSASVVIKARGAVSQTADLAEFIDSNGALLSKIGSNGGITTNGMTNTFGNLLAPTIGSTSTLTTGGTLAQNTTYWYQMTATNAAGETVGSASASQLTGNTTATNTITLNWPQIAGATGYKIYRNTSNSFGSGSLLLTTLTNGTTITYIDTGSATSAGFPPTAPIGTKTVVQAWQSQTANAFEVQAYNGTTYLAVGSAGGALTISGGLTIQNGNGISISGSVNGSTTLTSFVGATVQLGATPAAAGAIRLGNAASISWRNAANTGDKSIKLSSVNVTDALDLPGSVVVGGSDATGGTVYFFNATTGIGRTGNSGLKLFTGNGTTGLEVLNNSKNNAVGIGAASDFTNGTVEKLRVGTVTTVDNSANIMFGTTATTSKGLVIQGLASQSANLFETQASTGVANFVVYYDGTLRTNGNGFQFWKDNTPSKAVNVGMAVPGSANGDNLVFSAYNGSAWSEKARITNSSGTLEIGSTGSPGTVEKLRVNTPTTVDNLANVIFGTSATTSKGLVVQGIASQTANLQEWQDSTGAVKLAIAQNGDIISASGANGGVINIYAGQGTTNGGNININGGGGDAGTGGTVTIYGGSNFNGTAGGIVIDAGDYGGGGGGAPGAVTLGAAYTDSVTIGNTIGSTTTNIKAGTGLVKVSTATADGTTVAQFNNSGGTTCTVQPGGTGFACSSDARLKTNVLTLDNASDIVSKLRGVSFNWITNPNGQGQSGFIAQELEQLIPNAVSTDSNGYKVANYSAIIPYLVEALKQQQADITALKAGQTPQGGTSVDALKILADAKVVSLSGDLTVGGNVVVKGRLETGSANSGVVIIPAGQTTIRVTYPEPFTTAPRPSLTPKGVVKTYFGVTNETKTGFDIELSDPLTTDSQFNWQAL